MSLSFFFLLLKKSQSITIFIIFVPFFQQHYYYRRRFFFSVPGVARGGVVNWEVFIFDFSSRGIVFGGVKFGAGLGRQVDRQAGGQRTGGRVGGPFPQRSGAGGGVHPARGHPPVPRPDALPGLPGWLTVTPTSDRGRPLKEHKDENVPEVSSMQTGKTNRWASHGRIGVPRVKGAYLCPGSRGTPPPNRSVGALIAECRLWRGGCASICPDLPFGFA